MKTTHHRRLFALTISTFLLAVASSPVAAQMASGFTYQGKLTGPGDTPVNSPTSLRFELFNAAEGGTSLAGPVTRTNVAVTEGVFTADVDFGNVFQSGNGGWVEITVLDDQNNPTVLSPRQKVNPAPLARGIAGLNIVSAGDGVDIDNTANLGPVSIYGSGGPDTAYVTFVAGTTGQLTGVTFRLFTPSGTPTFFATVYAGVGTTGTELGSVAQVVPSTGSDAAEFTLDLSSQNIFLAFGQAYSISILCGADFALTDSPAPGTGGRDTSGSPINWWFRTRMQRPLSLSYATQAGTAATAFAASTAATAMNAINAENAVYATNAENALRALGADDSLRAINAVYAANAHALNASDISGLNDQEFRLRAASDDAHGIGWFGGSSSFRNTGFAPDGPIVFGYAGGALGTSVNGNGVIALQWNGAGNVGIGTAPGAGFSGYRLQLPNTASPAGQGRANAWVTYSSGAYKEDIQTLSDPLTTLSRLRGVQFTWKDALPDGTRKHDVGFIAEEVAAVVPELVTRTPDGAATGLDYGKVVPITVEAIKAQQAEIAALKAANAELTARLESIEATLKSQR